jgi:O-antigen/teichoic acid export membrane protein
LTSDAWTYLLLRSGQQASLFLGGIIVARYLGPEGRAEYVLPLALGGVVWGLSHLSLDGAAARLLANREATIGTLAGWLSAAVLVISCLAVPICLVLGLLTADAMLAHASFPLIIVTAATIPCLLALQMAEGLLLCEGALRTVGLIGAVSGVLYLATIPVIALLGQLTPVAVLIATLASFFAAAGTAVVALARRIGFDALVPRWPQPIARRGLVAGITMHPATLGRQLAERLDLLLMGLVLSVHDAGLYSLAATLVGSTVQASFNLAQTAIPTQTSAVRTEAVTYTARFTRQSVRLTAAVAAAFALIAYPFIIVVYGDEWRGAVLPFVVMTVGAIAVMLELPVHALIVRAGRPGRLSALTGARVVVNVGAILLLASAFGVVGAALAFAITAWAYALSVLALAARDTNLPVRDLFRLDRTVALPPPGA